jgi:hypothetical protein
LAQELALQPHKLLFMPDALFAVRSHIMEEYISLDKVICTSNFVTHPEFPISKTLELKPKGYICLSVASRPPVLDISNWTIWFTYLVKSLQSNVELPLGIIFLGLLKQEHFFTVPITVTVSPASKSLMAILLP